jgi:RNA polymerase sigma-70 factor (ECF subfamily)
MKDEPGGELLARFVQGDLDAFECLYREYHAEVYQWAMRIVRDVGIAEDVLVDAFWRAYRGRAQFDISRSFGAWMRRITTNVALDQLRSMRSRARWVTIHDQIAAPAAMAHDGMSQSVIRAFRKLSPKLQIVATLALIEELPYAEIADALHLPVGTIKSRSFRAIRALRKELAQLGIQP